MAQNKTKMYNAAFTPATISRATDSRGRKFIRARGTIARQSGEPVERTVLVQGKHVDAIGKLLKKGAEITLRGIYERAPAQEGATRGGEFFTALCIPAPRKAATA